jgi:hypothetical protein
VNTTNVVHALCLHSVICDKHHTHSVDVKCIIKQQTRDFIESYLISFPVFKIKFGVLYIYCMSYIALRYALLLEVYAESVIHHMQIFAIDVSPTVFCKIV